MGRVVFGKNAEPEKWFRLDSLLQDIAAHQPSDRSIVPSQGLAYNSDRGARSERLARQPQQASSELQNTNLPSQAG